MSKPYYLSACCSLIFLVLLAAENPLKSQQLWSSPHVVAPAQTQPPYSCVTGFYLEEVTNGSTTSFELGCLCGSSRADVCSSTLLDRHFIRWRIRNLDLAPGDTDPVNITGQIFNGPSVTFRNDIPGNYRIEMLITGIKDEDENDEEDPDCLVGWQEKAAIDLDTLIVSDSLYLDYPGASGQDGALDFQAFTNPTIKPGFPEALKFQTARLKEGPKARCLYSFQLDPLTNLPAGFNLSTALPKSSYDARTSTWFWTTTLDPKEETGLVIPYFARSGVPYGTILEFPYTYDIFDDSTGSVILEGEDTLRVTVVNAWDPNRIVAEPEEVLSPGNPIRFTVMFENIGNYPVYRVWVNQLLPQGLDLSSVRDLQASFDGKVLGRDQSIDLPGLNHRPVGHNHQLAGRSLGWILQGLPLGQGDTGSVSFTINALTSIQPGDSIENYADIIFEGNPAIETNHVFHHYKKREIKLQYIPDEVLIMKGKGIREAFKNPKAPQTVDKPK